MSVELIGDAGPSTELENALTNRDEKNVDEDDPKSPPTKRLKQSRLPFSPLVQQQEVSSNTLALSVKRKQASRESLKKFTYVDENEEDEVSSTQMDTETAEIDVEIEISDDERVEEIEIDNANVLQNVDKSLSDGISDESVCEVNDDECGVEDSTEIAVNDEPVTPGTKAKKPVNRSKNERSLSQKIRAERIEKNRIEREEKRKEREKLKEEARLKKEEKQKEIQAKKQESEMRKEERKLMLEEKRRRKEEKQLEAQAKKTEEKQALEEKKKQQELEKSFHEEEEQRRNEKAKASFARFFVKKENSNSTQRKEEFRCLFRAFEVKENQRLAPVNRLKSDEREKLAKDLNECIRNQTETELYLTELRCKKRMPRKSDRTWPLIDETDDDVQVVDADKTCERKTPRAKLLKFHENVRPPYWGTWRKKSEFVLSRNPFRKDIKYFDYEVDSDEEWEEEEPGESLSGTEDEAEKSDGEYDVDNEFVVPHGYLSEGEQDEEDSEVLTIDGQKMKLQLQEKEFLEERKEKCSQIKPKLFGPIWCDDQTPGIEEIIKHMKKFEPVLLCADLPIKTNKLCPTPAELNKSQDGIASNSTSKSTSLRLKSVPEEAMPHFVRLVHANTHRKPLLVKEFVTFWGAHQGEAAEEQENYESVPLTPVKKSWIPKTQVVKCLNQIASWSFGKKMWLVKTEILEKYSLTHLSFTNDWNYLTKIDDIAEVVSKTDEAPKTPTVVDASNVQERSDVEKSVKDVILTPKSKNLTLDTFFKRNISINPKENDNDAEVIEID